MCCSRGWRRSASSSGLAFWLGLAIDWLFEPSPAVRVVMWIAAAAAAGCRGVAIHRPAHVCRAAQRQPRAAGRAQVPAARAKGFVTTVQAAGDDGDAGSSAGTMLDASARRTAEALADVRLGRVFDFRPLVRKLAVAAAAARRHRRLRRARSARRSASGSSGCGCRPSSGRGACS